MKILFLIFAIYSLAAGALEMDQYPEERTYTSADQGYSQYGAPSLYKSGKYVLTFDDGPDANKTPLLLDVLKKHNAKAIFFVITSRINERTFPLIKRMLDEGHLVGSHGREHDNSNLISKEEWKSKVKQSFVELAKWYKRAGHTFNKIYYRYPYAAYGRSKDHHHMNTLKEISQELLGANCIQFAFWDIDSGDWIPKMSSSEVVNNLIATNQGGEFITYKTVNGTIIKKYTNLDTPPSGGVILHHDIQATSINTAEKFLTYVEERNLQIVRIDEVEEFKVTQNCELN